MSSHRLAFLSLTLLDCGCFEIAWHIKITYKKVLSGDGGGGIDKFCTSRKIELLTYLFRLINSFRSIRNLMKFGDGQNFERINVCMMNINKFGSGSARKTTQLAYDRGQVRSRTCHM